MKFLLYILISVSLLLPLSCKEKQVVICPDGTVVERCYKTWPEEFPEELARKWFCSPGYLDWVDYDGDGVGDFQIIYIDDLGTEEFPDAVSLHMPDLKKKVSPVFAFASRDDGTWSIKWVSEKAPSPWVKWLEEVIKEVNKEILKEKEV